MTKNSIPIPIVASPQQPRFIHQGMEFRIATFRDAPELCWTVYAGVDGSVVVYKRDRQRWEKLRPTLKNHGYYFVSIAKAGGGYYQPYVQQVILNAFRGPPPTPSSVGKHQNDDPSDNSLANLSWGTKSENAREAHAHRRHGSSPPEKRIQVPVRRVVVDRLRKIGPPMGRPFEDFVEQILIDYLNDQADRPVHVGVPPDEELDPH